jgi:hypothetical protein
MAFLLQLAGKVGSFVAVPAGNDYRYAFLTYLPSSLKTDAAIRSRD